MTIKEIIKATYPYEKELAHMVSNAGGRSARVESIKNLLFNNRQSIYDTAELMESQERKIRELSEMNAALNQALAEADGKRSTRKKKLDDDSGRDADGGVT